MSRVGKGRMTSIEQPTTEYRSLQGHSHLDLGPHCSPKFPNYRGTGIDTLNVKWVERVSVHQDVLFDEDGGSQELMKLAQMIYSALESA